jgi:hypothetical protein
MPSGVVRSSGLTDATIPKIAAQGKFGRFVGSLVAQQRDRWSLPAFLDTDPKNSALILSRFFLDQYQRTSFLASALLF